MYEIWLVLNILWELALGVWPLIVAALLAWGVLIALAARRADADWAGAARLAVLAGVALAALAFVLVPGWTRSSLGEMKYWVDWANLLGIAAAVGAVGAAVIWPLGALMRRRA
jgi:hypothetical protein